MSTGAVLQDGQSTFLSDEEILGIDSAPSEGVIPHSDREIPRSARNDNDRGDRPRNDTGAPNNGYGVQENGENAPATGEASELSAFREMFPGGAEEARALRQAAQGTESLREAARAVDQIDAAIYSGDARAQAEVVAELARANPAAFRSLFAEAARVLAGMGAATPNGAIPVPSGYENRQRDSSSPGQRAPRNDNAIGNAAQRNDTPGPNNGYGAQAAHAAENGHAAQAAAGFDAAAYASFERSTNDAVARDVRGAVTDTLARVLPEGVAEGAARRIGEDIFQEVHRTLAADRALSEQIGDVLRGRQFGAGEQQRVAQILSGRARQVLPAVARRVISEWTTSVLGTARTRSARQAAAASRVDIAAPGGSLDSTPLRPLSTREVDYARMSDEDILSM